MVYRWRAGFGANEICRCTESGDSSPLGHCLPFNKTRLMRAFRQTRKVLQTMHSGTRCKSELCVQRALVLRLTRRSMHATRDFRQSSGAPRLCVPTVWTRKFACPPALFSARQARASEQQEIAFRSTGSVSDFSVTPDGISGRLYKTSVLDIAVTRASAATPLGHLSVPDPLYSKWHKTQKGVPRSACCVQFAKQVLDKGPWTLVIRASQRFANREPTGRVIIVTDSSIAQ